MTDRPLVLCAPAPRSLELIFTPERLAELRARYELLEVEAPQIPGLPDEVLARVRYVLGQPPLEAEVLARMTGLRAVLNVEGNLLPNMPYDDLFARGVHVLTTGPVFALPVAELGLGMALDLLRGISGADRAFREGREAWGLEGNGGARLLSGADVGIIGFGDLGRALRRVLAGFGCRIRAHDPWLPDALLREQGVAPASLGEVLEGSDVVFVVSAVTTENRGALGAEAFAAMRPGAALVLLSRAEVVDFEALLDAVEAGRIRAASDVFPEEPMPADHRVRRMEGFLRSAHRAGALEAAFLEMGELVLDDMALMDRDLPPLRCKRADRETARRLRSRPVEKS
jgi:phosphoglycerate dehydrogenase-like enzyme